jgi:GABA(A) receptor-associated protein
LTAYHFNYIIRKRIKLPEKDSLYFFVNGKYLLKGGKLFSSEFILNFYIDTLMAHVYDKRKDPDGFLYITYTDETTLGAMEVVEDGMEM